VRLNSFDYFRSLAILFIVAGHSYGPWTSESFLEKILASLISGSTVFFVFISGFFFHYIFYPKFQYKQFILKKVQNVLLPYTILTLLGIFCLVYFLDDPPFAEVFIEGRSVDGYYKLWLWIQYWWTGSILTGYWYVPFIMIIFALSPFFIKLINADIRAQLSVFFLLLGVSCLIHRPLYNLSPVHSVIYFLPIYVLGIICSIYKDNVSRFLEGKSILLGLSVVLMSVLQIYLYDSFGNFHKETMFSYAGIDIMLLQKILMCFFLLSVLKKLDNKEIPFLKYLASASFAIYFLHPWVLYFLYESSILDQITFLPSILIALSTVLFVVAMCLLIATFIRWLFQESSRFVIGW
jgi:probable poly-beta-1,6-N-acetyl-D-glucosamine export protein